MTFKRRKIAVIGAGFTGATTALYLAQKELGDIVLVDIPQLENPTKGKALDMMEATPVLGVDANITGTSSYEDIKDADIVIITAGVARKPGMSRDDLVNINAGIMKSVAEQVKVQAPNSYIIVLSNPVDAMTYVAYKVTGFPRNRVIGQSGVLDTARFRTFVAQALNVSVEDVNGFVLGGHGDTMVPLIRYSFAGGIPLEKLLPKDQLDAIVARTRTGGGEIVNLLGSVSIIIFNIHVPEFSGMRIRGDIKSIEKKFSGILVFFYILYLTGSIFVICFSEDILNIFGSKTQLIERPVLIFMLIIYFLESNHSIFATMITTKNEVPFAGAAIYSGLSISLLSFIFLKNTNWGVVGVLTSQFIVQLLYNNWKWPYVVLKDFKTNFFKLIFTGIKLNIIKKGALS